MRTLEFRAWVNDGRSTMIRAEDIDHIDFNNENGNIGWYGVDGEEQPDGSVEPIQTQEVTPLKYATLMQYTGLKDKNGKKIFEGDIVQRKDWHTDENGSCRLSDDNSYMKKSVIEFDLGKVFQGYNTGDSYEIIGNIYENPELLTPNK